MTSIMQKINEDVLSVIEYMANNTSEVRVQNEGVIFTLTLSVEDVPTEDVEE